MPSFSRSSIITYGIYIVLVICLILSSLAFTQGQGTNGINGKDGKNGKDGIDGKDGINGVSGGGSAFSIDEKAQNHCISLKNMSIGANSEYELARVTGAGRLTKLWFACVNINPGQCFINMKIDGVYTVGNNIKTGNTDGLNSTGLALDMLFSAAGGQQTSVATKYFGTNQCNSNAIGGYIAFDMPYKNSFEITISNPTSSSTGLIWSQTYYTVNESIPFSLSPLKLYIQPFRWSSTVYGQEYPLLSASGPNGIFLKGIKLFSAAASGSWWEGRFRTYTGGPGLSLPMNGLHFTGTNFSETTPYDPTATTIAMSSGMEDYFDSSWNWAGVPTPMSSDYSGLLYNSAGSGNPVGPTTAVSAYKFFTNNALPSSSANENLVLTWTSGDPAVGQSGSLSFILGQVYYYA